MSYAFVDNQVTDAYAAFAVPNRYPVRMGSAEEVGGQEGVATRAYAAWDKYFTVQTCFLCLHSHPQDFDPS